MFSGTALPFLPGYTFTNPAKKSFTSKETLRYSKGCPFADVVEPDTPRSALQLLDAQNRIEDNTLVDLTYGPRREFLKKADPPEYVPLDKEILRFYGYYREEVNDCWGEEFRIHRVRILYYLRDDEMEIWLPHVENSGLVHGKLLRKQAVPKPDGEAMYKWKDLNIGMDLIVYGKRIRITDCDEWTKEYMTSAGVAVNPKMDDIPEDSYSKKLREKSVKPRLVSHNLNDEKLWKFLNKNQQVLRFYALWDDTNNDPKEMRKVKIHYFLEDDTMEVVEVHSVNDGRDPFPMVIRRQKIPIDIYAVPDTFPSCYMEYSNKEIRNWFLPKDLVVGKTITVMQKKFFIYNCDKFTRKYYQDFFDFDMPPAIDVEEKPKKPVPKNVPPHDGIGTWEDSLQSCIYAVPRPPKKDVLKAYESDNKYLRFRAHMDTEWPIDRSRQFIITFFVGDDTVSIFEPVVDNSGIDGGRFLRRTRLRKPSQEDKTWPEYYEAADFYVDAIIYASGRKFVIDSADRYVLSFMEANSQYYPPELIEKHRGLLVENILEEEPKKSSKEFLQERMRKIIVKTFGSDPVPLPVGLEGCQRSRRLVADSLYASYLPIPRNLLDEALDLCTEDNGNISLPALKKIFLFCMGHPQQENDSLPTGDRDVECNTQPDCEQKC